MIEQGKDVKKTATWTEKKISLITENSNDGFVFNWKQSLTYASSFILKC
jgi:hypothetical protein